MAGPVNARWTGSREKLMKQLLAISPTIEADLGAAELAMGEKLAGRIRQRAPTSNGPSAGEYRDSILAARLADMPQSVNAKNPIASRTKDKNAVGIYAAYFWHWLEFGTASHSTVTGARRARNATAGSGPGMHPGTAAQPHIFPTYRAAKKEIRRATANVVNRAVRAAIKKNG